MLCIMVYKCSPCYWPYTLVQNYKHHNNKIFIYIMVNTKKWKPQTAILYKKKILKRTTYIWVISKALYYLLLNISGNSLLPMLIVTTEEHITPVTNLCSIFLYKDFFSIFQLFLNKNHCRCTSKYIEQIIIIKLKIWWIYY